MEPAVISQAETSARRVTTPRPPPTVRVNTQTLDRFLSTVGEVILNANQVRTSSETRDAAEFIKPGLNAL